MGNLVKETPYSEITATLEVLDKHGVTREDLKALRSNLSLVQQVVAAIKQMALQIYTVTVNHNLPLAEMIKACQLDWANKDIIENYFPITGTGQEEVELVLVHLNRHVTTNEVLKYLSNQNLKVGKTEHYWLWAWLIRSCRSNF